MARSNERPRRAPSPARGWGTAVAHLQEVIGVPLVAEIRAWDAEVILGHARGRHVAPLVDGPDHGVEMVRQQRLIAVARLDQEPQQVRVGGSRHVPPEDLHPRPAGQGAVEEAQSVNEARQDGLGVTLDDALRREVDHAPELLAHGPAQELVWIRPHRGERHHLEGHGGEQVVHGRVGEESLANDLEQAEEELGQVLLEAEQHLGALLAAERAREDAEDRGAGEEALRKGSELGALLQAAA